MMSRLDQIIDDAVERRAAPFLVAMVADHGAVRWEHAAGRANAVHDAGPDTVFTLWSMTKAIGGLMGVMAIDRGLITMDTPVGDIIPRFDEMQVLESVGPEGPIFRKPKRRGTLRHVLTHTVGMGYRAFYPLMAEYADSTGAPADTTGKIESLYYPLLFDPGEDFAYGVGTDWVGAIVSELCGRPVEQFVREEILQPLGMNSTYFERAEAGDRLADQVLKLEDGRFERCSSAVQARGSDPTAPLNVGNSAAYYPPEKPELYHMGHALYSSPSDYMRFLRLVLGRGELDGQRFVGSDAMDLMFTDQTNGVTFPSPLLKSSIATMCDTEPCPGARKSHTAAFFRSEEALPGMRSAGSLTWAGLLNTHYWVDPARDIAAVFMTQMLPFFDPELMSYFDEFERVVCKEFNS
jgi:methyl acetate hydrolase